MTNLANLKRVRVVYEAEVGDHLCEVIRELIARCLVDVNDGAAHEVEMNGRTYRLRLVDLVSMVSDASPRRGEE